MIKAKGVARFFDWEMLAKLYEKPEDILNIATEQAKLQGFSSNKSENTETKKTLRSLSQLFKDFFYW